MSWRVTQNNWEKDYGIWTLNGWGVLSLGKPYIGFSYYRAYKPDVYFGNPNDNARGAINELQGKLGDSQNLLNGLQNTYSSSGTIPNDRHFSGLDAIAITYCNGMAEGQIRRIPVNGYKKDPRTCWVPRSGVILPGAMRDLPIASPLVF